MLLFVFSIRIHGRLVVNEKWLKHILKRMKKIVCFLTRWRIHIVGALIMKFGKACREFISIRICIRSSRKIFLNLGNSKSYGIILFHIFIEFLPLSINKSFKENLIFPKSFNQEFQQKSYRSKYKQIPTLIDWFSHIDMDEAIIGISYKRIQKKSNFRNELWKTSNEHISHVNIQFNSITKSNFPPSANSKKPFILFRLLS